MEITKYRYRQGQSWPQIEPNQITTPKKTKKRPRMWPFLILAIIAAYCWLAISKPLPSPKIEYDESAGSLQAGESKLIWPTNTQAAITSLGGTYIINSPGDQRPKPIASVAKTITALAVLAKKPLIGNEPGPSITLSAKDVDIYSNYVARNGSVVQVIDGETLTQRQALEALMLPSANNIADSLAIWAFGSIENYTLFANKLMIDYGLSQTTIADASGMSPNTKSTAIELLTIGRRLLQNQTLKNIVSEKTAVLPVVGEVSNVNRLLGSQNVIGIKTGNTDEAGGCLLFAANRIFDDKHSDIIVGAVLGDQSIDKVFDSVSGLLASAETELIARPMIRKDQIVGKIKTDWGSQSDIIAANNLVFYGWKSDSRQASRQATMEKFAYPIKQNASLATAFNSSSESKIELKLKSNVPGPSIWWRLSHYF